MSKQIVQPVKGTRDFYPQDLSVRNWLYDKLKVVSFKFGYQEFDSPLIEYLDLYTDKTSEEILKEETFTLKDRDGRTLVLRPEITPSFARMVAQRAQVLPKPIRWFSFGRAWRYEQPQKGRGREFFQWEINILGPETPAADAEIIAVAVEFFKEIGLSSDEVVIKISDRSYFDQILKENDIPQDKFMPLLRIIDHKEKVSQEEFTKNLKAAGLNTEQVAALERYLQNKDYSGSSWLSELFSLLKQYPGVLAYVEYNPTIARGFDYYTRTVFEAWDKTGNLKRALFGGGRFDNLTATIGGERVPGVGMAPGDMPIEELLKALNKLPAIAPPTTTVLVTVFSPNLYNYSLSLVNQLRQNDINSEIWPEPQAKLEKQLKYADTQNIPFAVIAGPDEAEKNMAVLKNLNTKSQEILSPDELIIQLKKS